MSSPGDPRPPSPPAPSAAEAAGEVVTLLGRFYRRLREAKAPATGDGPLALSLSQTSLLGRLDRAGETTASALAVAERVRPQSLSATLAVLLDEGLVSRRPDPHDGRRQLVSLTDAGRTALEDRRRTGHDWLARAMAERLTEDERQQVLTALVLLDRVSEP